MDRRFLVFFLGIIAISLSSCSPSSDSPFITITSTSPKLLNEKPSSNPTICIWGYVLDIFNSPIGGATVKIYVLENGEKNLKATYTTNSDGFFVGYYYYSIVVLGDTVIFEATDSTGILTGSSRTYATIVDSSPCLYYDLHPAAHDTIYLSKSGGASLW